MELGKVGVGSRIAQNHSSDHYLPKFTSKADQIEIRSAGVSSNIAQNQSLGS